jgi:Predicted metal-dependent membrane protease
MNYTNNENGSFPTPQNPYDSRRDGFEQNRNMPSQPMTSQQNNAYYPQYQQNEYTNPAQYPSGYVQNVSVHESRRASYRKTATKAINGMALIGILHVGIMLLLQMLIEAFFSLFGIYRSMLGDEFMFWLSAILTVGTTFSVSLIYLLVKRPALSEIFHFQKASKLNVVLGIVAGVGICMLANCPAGFLRRALEFIGYKQASFIPRSFNPRTVWIYYLGVAVLPPVLEEILFRGIIMRGLEKYGKLFALLVSSILFGIVHMELTIAVFATICGMVCGFLYMKTRNIWVPIAVHFFNNLLGVTSTFFFEWFGKDANLMSAVLILAMASIGIIALVLLLLLNKETPFFNVPDVESKNSAKASAGGAMTFSETVIATAKSVCFWAMVAMLLIMMIVLAVRR